jgi:uncharacterized protein YdeI (YjbR/CyaY-like superfamily)
MLAPPHIEPDYNRVQTTYASDQTAWRRWLADNHNTAKSVWLVIFRKQGQTPSVTYDEAVDEALCFGWIDSSIAKRDAESYYQFFARRNPKSNWSRVNKLKIEKLVAENRMAPAGSAMVELAQETGTWDALNDVEDLIYPPDLRAAFAENPTAEANFNQFPRSAKRGILEWLLNAKQPITRQKRIAEIVSKAEINERANSFTRR